MKTKIFVVMIVLSISFFGSASAEDHAPGLYLEVTETKADPFASGSANVWVPVADRADALAKFPDVIAQYFSGKTYEARLHWHYLDRPCVVEPLP